IRLWDVMRHRLVGPVLHGDLKDVDNVVFSPDGATLASAGPLNWPLGSGNGAIQLWDVAHRRHRLDLIGSDGSTGQCLSFSPNGTLLADCTNDGNIVLWDTRNDPGLGGIAGVLSGTGGYLGQLIALAFSPDGKTLASGGLDRTIRLWDVAQQ